MQKRKQQSQRCARNHTSMKRKDIVRLQGQPVQIILRDGRSFLGAIVKVSGGRVHFLEAVPTTKQNSKKRVDTSGLFGGGLGAGAGSFPFGGGKGFGLGAGGFPFGGGGLGGLGGLFGGLGGGGAGGAAGRSFNWGNMFSFGMNMVSTIMPLLGMFKI